MGCKAFAQFKKATDPGARYIRKGPIAIVLSNRDTHGSVPGVSSTIGLPLLEPGRSGEVDVVKAMIRTDGRLKRTSTCGSGEEALLDGGRLNERLRTGLESIAVSATTE